MKCLICTLQFTKSGDNNIIGNDPTIIKSEKEDNLSDSFSQQQFKRDLWFYFCSHFHVSNDQENSLIDPSSNDLQLPFCLKCEKDVNQLFKLNCNLIKIQEEMQHLTANISSSILLTASAESPLNSMTNNYKSNNANDDLTENNDKQDSNTTNGVDHKIDKIREEITQHFHPQVVLCDVMSTQIQNQNNNSTNKTIQNPPVKMTNVINNSITGNSNNEADLLSAISQPYVVFICREPECERRKFCNLEIWKNHQKYHQLPKTVRKHEDRPSVYIYKDQWEFKGITDSRNDFQCLTCDKILKYYSRILDHIRDVHADPPNCECGQRFHSRTKLASHLKEMACWSGKQMERWISVRDEEGNISFLYENVYPISILETRLNVQVFDPDASFRCETCGFESSQRGLMTDHIQAFHINPDSSLTNNDFMDSWRSNNVEGDEPETDVNVQIKVDYPQVDPSLTGQAENFLSVEIKTEADENDNDNNINLKVEPENPVEETIEVDGVYNCEFEYETVLEDDPGVLPFLHEEVTEVMGQTEYELSSSSSASASLLASASPFLSESMAEGEILYYKQWTFVSCGKRSFICLSCGAKEQTQKKMKEHIQIFHANEAVSECWEDETSDAEDSTDNPVQNKKRKTEIMNQIEIVDEYKCCVEGCSRSYRKLEDLELHKKLHSGKRLQCSVKGCNSSFVQESVMVTHMWAVHKKRFSHMPQGRGRK